jgi:acyl-CoA thioester hydrolase
MTGRELAPIVISVNCNYRRQLRHPDVVQIGVRVAHMRRTSMAMHQVAFSRSSGELAVEGTTTVVFFDHLAHRPRRIPQEVRAAIEAFEGRSIPLEPPLPEKP